MVTATRHLIEPYRSDLAAQGHILLQDISWETFEELITELESQPSNRLTYDNGQLEIWMPLIPHESYKRWLGEAAIRGKMDIDLTTDSPPDLAIEIDITSLSLPRLPIYSALGIPEVWRFDGESVQILALNQTTYGEVSRSIALPPITPEVLQNFLEQAKTMGETSWAKSVCQWATLQH